MRPTASTAAVQHPTYAARPTPPEMTTRARYRSPVHMSTAANESTKAPALVADGRRRASAITTLARARSSSTQMLPSANCDGGSMSRSAETLDSHSRTNIDPPSSQPSSTSSIHWRAERAVPGKENSAPATSAAAPNRATTPDAAASDEPACKYADSTAAVASSHQARRRLAVQPTPATRSSTAATLDTIASQLSTGADRPRCRAPSPTTSPTSDAPPTTSSARTASVGRPSAGRDALMGGPSAASSRS